MNVAKESSDKENYLNLRSELHWGIRMRFHGNDINGLVDEKTKGQLAAIRCRYNARGQLVIEDKEKMRDSPDRAEALMLAFATDLLGVGVA